MLRFLHDGKREYFNYQSRDLDLVTKEYEKTKPTVLTAVNTLFNAMLNHEPFRNLDHSHMKIACGGGMAVQQSVADEWKKITGCPIAEGYGLTESSPILSLNPVDGSGNPGLVFRLQIPI